MRQTLYKILNAIFQVITGQKLFMSEVWRFTLRNVETGEERLFMYKNLIPTVGRAAIANYLTNASPSPATLRVTHTSLGTGIAGATNADTQLQTETYRKAIASATNGDNVAYMTAFYTAPEVTGTFKEAGLHIAGSLTPNSGTLFSRVPIDITKTALETLTVDYTVTIT